MSTKKTVLIIALVLVLLALVLWFGGTHNKGVDDEHVFSEEETAQALQNLSAPAETSEMPLTSEQKKAIDTLSAPSASNEVFGDTQEEQDILKSLEAKP